MEIVVSVYLDSNALANNKHIFNRSVVWDSSLSFPFEQTVCTLRSLFGSLSVVTFIVLPL